jgi:hypothetical protein
MAIDLTRRSNSPKVFFPLFSGFKEEPAYSVRPASDRKRASGYGLKLNQPKTSHTDTEEVFVLKACNQLMRGLGEMPPLQWPDKRTIVLLEARYAKAVKQLNDSKGV